MALKIGKLFSLGGGGEGPTGLDLTNPEGRVKAIFAEILAASQQRRITISVGNAELIMDAGSKQMYRVISVKPETLRFAKATGIESRSYDNLDNQLIIITQLFAEIASIQGEFDMVSRPVPTPYPPKLEGFSPDELKFAYSRYAPTPAVATTTTPRQDAVAAAEAAISVTAPEVTTPAAPPSPPQVAPVAAPAPPPPPVAVQKPTAPQGDMPLFPDDPVPVATALLTADARTAFHDALAGYCDITMLMNTKGEVLKHTQNAPAWPEMAKDIAEDALRWVKNTSSILPPKQLVVMRSRFSQSHSICFFADGEYVTFGVINSVAIGRLFIAANEFIA
ncbi:MAG: hypothetical protein ABI459_08315 [Deltaproteobacteria bacterium]